MLSELLNLNPRLRSTNLERKLKIELSVIVWVHTLKSQISYLYCVLKTITFLCNRFLTALGYFIKPTANVFFFFFKEVQVQRLLISSISAWVVYVHKRTYLPNYNVPKHVLVWGKPLNSLLAYFYRGLNLANVESPTSD